MPRLDCTLGFKPLRGCLRLHAQHAHGPCGHCAGPPGGASRPGSARRPGGASDARSAGSPGGPGGAGGPGTGAMGESFSAA